MTGCAETSCATCAHAEVCKFKEDFLKAKSTIDDTMVHLGDRRSIYLRDMKFISNVVLLCQHYKINSGGTIR